MGAQSKAARRAAVMVVHVVHAMSGLVGSHGERRD
jgi:hypothetical protein